MAIPSVAELLAFLRQHQLLSVTQLEELDRMLSPSLQDARVLAKELLQRDWLTAYQVNQILQGKGQELILGGYVLLERIGEGGMGTVFKAWQRSLGRVVALKVIRQERLANPQAIKRFEHEVRAAAQLNHVNVVRAYDADRVGDCHFLVMEFVPGIDLARLVKHAGPLPVDRACEFIAQAAQGLQHAFENRMVHRDIKPHNLLLTAADDTVKVLDMGLARLERPENASSESSSTLTVDGAVMGSFDYIAPEQARNARKVDIRADLYGLGCTLYYLLAGQVPFPGGSAMEKLCKHQFEAPTPIEKLRPEVPAPVAAVVAKLMAKSADERYQTPAELVYALEHLNDAPSLTSAPTQADQPVDEATNSFSYMATSDTATDPNAPVQIEARRRKLWQQTRLTAAVGGTVLVLVTLVWIILANLKAPTSPDKNKGSTPVVSTMPRKIEKKDPASKSHDPSHVSPVPAGEPPPAESSSWRPLFAVQQGTITPKGSEITFTWQKREGEPILRVSGSGNIHVGDKEQTWKNFHLRFDYRYTDKPRPRQVTVYFFRVGGPEYFNYYISSDGRPTLCGNSMGNSWADPGEIRDGRVLATPNASPFNLRQHVTLDPGGEPVDGWNKLEVICLGQSAILRHNSKNVGVFANCRQQKPKGSFHPRASGAMCLGILGGGEVDLRHIEVRDITALPAEVLTPPRAIAPFDAKKAKEYQQLWAAHLGRKVEETNSVGMKLTLIPPGEFPMGSSTSLPEQGPRHRVQLTSPFFIGVHEVTQEAYERVMKRNPAKFQAGGPLFPVEQVSVEGAEEFCRQLSELPVEKQAGRRYRLPTEAEWEYAARAGIQGFFVFADMSNNARFNEKTPVKVGQYPANAWGLYDVHGNVEEWCADWFDPDYYRQSPAINPKGPPNDLGHGRVMRGGSWANSNAGACALGGRHGRQGSASWIGFRVVCEVVAPPEAGPWQPLFNGKDMAEWKVHPPEAAHLAKVVGDALELSSTEEIKLPSLRHDHPRGNYHLQFEVMSPSVNPHFAVTGLMNRNTNLGFRFRRNELPQASVYRGKLRQGILKDGRVVGQGDLIDIVPFSGPKPAPGIWYRIDLFRMGDALICLCDDQVVGMIADMQANDSDGTIRDLSETKTNGIQLSSSYLAKALFRNIKIRDITTIPPDILAKIAWRPLFNGKDLTGWTSNNTGKADVVVESGQPCLRLTPPIGLQTNEMFGDYHLRFEYKAEKGSSGGVHFFSEGYSIFQFGLFAMSFSPPSLGCLISNMTGEPAKLEDGRIVGVGKPLNNEKTLNKALHVPHFPLALAADSPWQRVEVIRLGDSFLFLVNGKIAGAATNVRDIRAGGEKLLGRSPFVFWTGGSNGSGPAQFRNIEVRDISAIPPEILENAAWRLLFNGKDLTDWKPSTASLVRVVDDAIEVTTTEKVGLVSATREVALGDFHLRLEIKSADAATPAQATFNALFEGGTAVGFGFPTKDFKNTTFAGIVNGEFRRGSWRDGRIVGAGEARNAHGYPGPRLETDRWQRVDFIRLGDTFVCFVDDRLVGMVGDARAKGAEGKGTDLAKTPCRGIHVGGTRSGKVLFRKIEIRAITTLPAEFLERIAWQALFNDKDLTGWARAGRGN